MKIQINENETYELTIPTIVSVRELGVIINKLQSVYKISSKMDVFDEPEGKPKEIGVSKRYTPRGERKESWAKVKESRKLVVKLYSTFYNTKGDDALKEVFEENNILSVFFGRKAMTGGQWVQYRKLHKIKPEEVNLRRFPGRGDDVRNLRIKPIKENGTSN